MQGDVVSRVKRVEPQSRPVLRLVLVGVEGPINLGSVARLAKNFSADELFLVKPVARLDDELAIRFAAHARDFLARAVIVERLEDALRGVDFSACTSAKVGQRSDVLRHPLTPWDFAALATRFRKVAVVFGRESVGLTRDEIALCDVLVSIPANVEYPVLNLSHAVAIILYELYKATRLQESQFRVEPANEELLRKLAQRLECIAEKVVTDQRIQQVKAALRHLLFKSGLTAGEASGIAYFVKRLVKRLGVDECLA